MRRTALLLVFTALRWTSCSSQYVYVQTATLVGAGAVGHANLDFYQNYHGAIALSEDGSTVVLGGSYDSNRKGAAWVFERRASGGWETGGTKLVGNGANGVASMGCAVGIAADGSTEAIGGPNDGINYTGATWVFTRVQPGAWRQQAKLVGDRSSSPASGTSQGSALGISADGTTIAVGGDAADRYVGGVWVFSRNATGEWVQQGSKLLGSGTAGSSAQGYWGSISISGDGNTLAVGGPYDNNGTGASWVFRRTNRVWRQDGEKLVGMGSAETANQGIVALSADSSTLAVGGYSLNSTAATWVFTRTNGVWTQTAANLNVTWDAGPLGPTSVALSASGGTLAVGGSNDTDGTGAAWVFKRSPSGQWQQQGDKLVSANTSLRSVADGISISGNGSVVAAAAPASNGGVGAALIFEQRVPSGAPCELDVPCIFDVCSAGRCVGRSPGASCASYAECLSLKCVRGKCQCAPNCTDASCGACEAPAVCQAGLCVTFVDTSVPSRAGTAPPTGPRPKVALIAGLAGGAALLTLLVLTATAAAVWRRRVRRNAHTLPPPDTHPLNALDAPSTLTAAAPSADSDFSLPTPFTPRSSRSSWEHAPSTLTQRECGASKGERKALLLRQLRHIYRSNATLLNSFRLLGDTPQHQRVGGQGVVQFACIAWDKDRQFALKFYLDAASFATERDHFMNPALHHVMPPIRSIEGNEDGSIQALGRPLPPFVATERGESLDEWQRRTNTNADLNFSNALHIVLHLVQRVGELHSAGLVHRDLKPGNVIWLPSRNEFTIIDLGSAAIIGSEAPMSLSVAYAAPETVLAWADGRTTVTADAAVDVWALGVIAFELLSMTPNCCRGRDAVVQTMRGKLPLPWEDTAADDYEANMQSLGFMREGVLRMVARDPRARPSLLDVQREWNSLFKRGGASVGAQTASSQAEGTVQTLTVTSGSVQS